MTTKKEMTKHEPAKIVTAATRELTPGIWAMIEKMAPAMYRSHLFGVTSIDQAEAIMLKGYELGLSVTASFELIHVIEGKPGLSPRGAMALLHNSPLIKEIKLTRLEDKGKFIGYECFMSRADNGFSHTSRFTLEMAAKAGLVKPGSAWVKYDENMCMYRAIGFCADVVGPDITAGMTNIMKAPEMFGVALSEGGDIIDVASTPIPTIDPLQALMDEYGPEMVVEAANGITGTPEQIAEEVRAKLEEAKDLKPELNGNTVLR